MKHLYNNYYKEASFIIIIMEVGPSLLEVSLQYTHVHTLDHEEYKSKLVSYHAIC